MQPRVRRTVRVEQNHGISLDKCSDMEHVHLTHNRCTIIRRTKWYRRKKNETHKDGFSPWENCGNEVRDP